jgi:dTDP-glucose 4,6-dehydratase
MSTHIVVTGGAGFIGSHFVKLMLRKYPDYTITIVDKFTYAGNPDNISEELRDDRVHLIAGDICTDWLLRRLDRYWGEPTHIVNFAAESFVDASIHGSKDPFVDSNVRGVVKLLDWVREHPTVRYVQVSTDEVYGHLPLKSDLVFTTKSPVQPRNPYSASKAAADHFVMSYVETYGIDAVITRCSNNYGPYQYPEKFIPRMILQAYEDKPLPVYGDGTNVRDWIRVEDHCRGVDLALHHGRSGKVYNFGGDNEVENLTVAQSILDLMGKPQSLVEFVTDRPGHDLRYAIDVSEANLTLGWAPTEYTTFDEGLEQTVRWYLDNMDWVDRIRSGANRSGVPHSTGDA